VFFQTIVGLLALMVHATIRAALNSAIPVPAKANIDLGIASFLPAQPAQFLPERRDLGLCGRIALGIPHHHADAPQAIELLRPRRERPRRCAAEQCYEIAPSKPIELHPLPLAGVAA
jgi:hypothetical protein